MYTIADGTPVTLGIADLSEMQRITLETLMTHPRWEFGAHPHWKLGDLDSYICDCGMNFDDIDAHLRHVADEIDKATKHLWIIVKGTITENE